MFLERKLSGGKKKKNPLRIRDTAISYARMRLKTCIMMTYTHISESLAFPTLRQAWHPVHLSPRNPYVLGP